MIKEKLADIDRKRVRKFLRVEIQIGTVVTQAWAEVQHNIVYKNPENILTTPTMKRIIDAINGMAITTDIMLKESRQGVEAAKEEAEKLDQTPFKHGVEFKDWFETTYLKMHPKERLRWTCDRNRACTLVMKWQAAWWEGEDTKWTDLCPKEVKRIIDRFAKKSPFTAEVDISLFLNKSLDEGWADKRNYSGTATSGTFKQRWMSPISRLAQTQKQDALKKQRVIVEDSLMYADGAVADPY